MSELEDRLGAILSNPQMMQQIMSMAQAMTQSGAGQGQSPPAPQQAPASQAISPAFPDIDPKLLRSLAAAGQSGVDPSQQALLQALSPYLSPHRISKLERAMQAAKLAKLASGFLNAGGLQLLTGR